LLKTQYRFIEVRVEVISVSMKLAEIYLIIELLAKQIGFDITLTFIEYRIGI